MGEIGGKREFSLVVYCPRRKERKSVMLITAAGAQSDEKKRITTGDRGQRKKKTFLSNTLH